MPFGPRKLRISCDGVGLTRYGGVALLHSLFQRLGLRRGMCRAIRYRQRNNDYSLGEAVEGLLYLLILGPGRVETTEPLGHNGVFQYLAGLPRATRRPRRCASRRDLSTHAITWTSWNASRLCELCGAAPYR